MACVPRSGQLGRARSLFRRLGHKMPSAGSKGWGPARGRSAVARGKAALYCAEVIWAWPVPATPESPLCGRPVSGRTSARCATFTGRRCPVGFRQEEQCPEAYDPRGQVNTPHCFRHLTMHVGHERRPPSASRATSDTTLARSPVRQWALCTTEAGHTVSTAHLRCRQRCHPVRHRSVDGACRSRCSGIRTRKGSGGRAFFTLGRCSPNILQCCVWRGLLTPTTTTPHSVASQVFNSV